MSKLSTTSYVALAFLETGPLSAYALVQQMSGSFKYLLPAGERKVYYEPKNLVAEGLAEAQTEHQGKRRRTVYSITAEGQQALAQWMKGPTAGPRLEFEGLTRVFFADLGDKEQLLDALTSIRAEMETWSKEGTAVGRDYLNGEAQNQHRAHIASFMFVFFWRFWELVQEWVTDVETEIATWEDTAPDREKVDKAMQRFAFPLGWGEPGSGIETS